MQEPLEQNDVHNDNEQAAETVEQQLMRAPSDAKLYHVPSDISLQARAEVILDLFELIDLDNNGYLQRWDLMRVGEVQPMSVLLHSS